MERLLIVLLTVALLAQTLHLDWRTESYFFERQHLRKTVEGWSWIWSALAHRELDKKTANFSEKLRTGRSSRSGHFARILKHFMNVHNDKCPSDAAASDRPSAILARHKRRLRFCFPREEGTLVCLKRKLTWPNPVGRTLFLSDALCWIRRTPCYAHPLHYSMSLRPTLCKSSSSKALLSADDRACCAQMEFEVMIKQDETLITWGSKFCAQHDVYNCG